MKTEVVGSEDYEHKSIDKIDLKKLRQISIWGEGDVLLTNGIWR